MYSSDGTKLKLQAYYQCIFRGYILYAADNVGMRNVYMSYLVSEITDQNYKVCKNKTLYVHQYSLLYVHQQK